MATVSQADIDAIRNALCVGILNRFTSVDALVDTLLKSIDQAPAQAVFTQNLIDDDRYPAGDVVTCVDAPAQAVFEPHLIVDDCYPAENVNDCHNAGDIFTSVDGFCQHVDAPIDPLSTEIDECHTAGEPGSNVEPDSHASCVKHLHPADVFSSALWPHVKLLFIDIKYPPIDITISAVIPASQTMGKPQHCRCYLQMLQALQKSPGSSHCCYRRHHR